MVFLSGSLADLMQISSLMTYELLSLGRRSNDIRELLCSKVENALSGLFIGKT